MDEKEIQLKDLLKETINKMILLRTIQILFDKENNNIKKKMNNSRK